ncbi:hypothetical protein ACRQ5Q_18610 [Bradyrhizobium sp. PMVTL-01]|uniref:hypothetical protein n=1 Tax=Bradyrhizobium sp. PMVTL-01 TaxID=3434999 RepID=UPI003F6FFF62
MSVSKVWICADAKWTRSGWHRLAGPAGNTYLPTMPKFEFCQPTVGKMVPAGPEWHRELKLTAQKITFAEMREMGVRGIIVFCADYRCGHSVALNARSMG